MRHMGKHDDLLAAAKAAAGMTTSRPAAPVDYVAALETPAADEMDAIDAVIRDLRAIQETTSRDYGLAVRGVHAKGQALVRGRLRVHDHLPPNLAQGLFATPRRT